VVTGVQTCALPISSHANDKAKQQEWFHSVFREASLSKLLQMLTDISRSVPVPVLMSGNEQISVLTAPGLLSFTSTVNTINVTSFVKMWTRQLAQCLDF